MTIIKALRCFDDPRPTSEYRRANAEQREIMEKLHQLTNAAADEIEELKAINADLLEALKIAAKALDSTADYVLEHTSHEATAVGIRYDAKAARAAIEKATTP